MQLPPALRDEIVAHALRDAPTECCGMVAVRDDVVEAVHPITNAKPSPFFFMMDATEQLRAINAIEDSGATFASYHSHTRSAPEPSQTDINLAKDWPGMTWLIVATGKPDPELRGWLIEHHDALRGAKVTEVELT